MTAWPAIGKTLPHGAVRKPVIVSDAASAWRETSELC
jgi:hypothetical protein